MLHHAAPSVSDSAREALTVEHASESMAAEWDAFVSAHPNATIDHLWRWRRIFEGVFKHKCEYLAARRAGTIAGILPLVLFDSRIFGRIVASLPFLNYGGVLAKDDAAAESLFAAAAGVAREFDARHVELRHTSRRFAGLPCRQHKLALTRPLLPTLDAQWSDLDRKIRNQVRKAQKDGLTVEVGGAQLVPDFYAVFARNMRDLGTPVYSKHLFSETARLFAAESRIFIVRSGTTPVAASLSLKFRDTVLVPWASSLREYRNQCANTLLYWRMFEDAIERGARVFDFGRSSPDTGPHHFKRQWGAVETPMHWEYGLTEGSSVPEDGPQSPRFATAVSVWQRLPLWLANRIGPSVVRHLP